ncbi:hypothetical protein ACFQHV_21740 [Promicromonospora thailandica]|uniref:LysM domain-containing protein n=1 Tax=Promicromonospora thailandica TaxID=765201 RepID=A0A9X2FXJ6_9MICO|nr:hypothetical protein [Promicromonospora thailandica]MCP2263170.1 hypothetical protein [Promicromonospora thailandica]BFF18556.1 hypothetical protein GCM10025730_20770 [Promicromonospora thailandica]
MTNSTGPGQTPSPTQAGGRGGVAGLLALGVGLVAAAGALGARTWYVGSGLGSALFPVDGIVELAAVSVGTVVAGWTGVHALVALAWVLVCRRGARWRAGERAVARHAPAVVRRLVRAALGAGVGLALTVPTAMAAQPAAAAPTAVTASTAQAADDPAVVRLGWRPTGGTAETTAKPAPERSALVNRGVSAGREPVVVVERGDTLWAIATDHLAETGSSGGAGTGAQAAVSDAEIAAAVDRWHDANRRVLGADPDLILPGTVLHRP